MLKLYGASILLIQTRCAEKMQLFLCSNLLVDPEIGLVEFLYLVT